MRQNLTIRIVVSIVALCFVAVHLAKPTVQIDSITVVLLVISALPWVQPLIKSIELLGVKLELQDLQTKVADARGAAESASRQADFAISASNARRALTPEAAAQTVGPEAIEELEKQYEHIRSTQREGDARTALMTDLIRRMVDLAGHVQSFQFTEALRDGGPGQRLFAYAYLYVHPELEEALMLLVDTVTTRENQPFGQYWGLQAIKRMIATPKVVPQEVKTRLEAFAAGLPPSSDRAYEVKKALEWLG